MSIEEVKLIGVMVLFGEKYGDIVCVVNMVLFLIELCGGIYVNNIVEIGFFKIVSEFGIGVGVRRIEVLIGKGVFLYFEEIEIQFNNIKNYLKVKFDN